MKSIHHHGGTALYVGRMYLRPQANILVTIQQLYCNVMEKDDLKEVKDSRRVMKEDTVPEESTSE